MFEVEQTLKGDSYAQNPNKTFVHLGIEPEIHLSLQKLKTH
jgi:hypothetical protein